MILRPHQMRRIINAYLNTGTRSSFHGGHIGPKTNGIGRERSLMSSTMESHTIAPHVSSPFDPPLNRSMRVLDRSLFQKTLPIAAATVFDDRNLSKVRDTIRKSGNLLVGIPVSSIQPDELVPGRKCILLMPGIEANGQIFGQIVN